MFDLDMINVDAKEYRIHYVSEYAGVNEATDGLCK